MPSFASMLEEKVVGPGIGTVTFDLGFGGAVKKTVMEIFKIEHPFEKDLSVIYGTISVHFAHDSGRHPNQQETTVVKNSKRLSGVLTTSFLKGDTERIRWWYKRGF